MANIQKRGNSYRIRVSDGFDPETGARKYRTKTWTPEPSMTENQIEKELRRQTVLFEDYCRKQTATGDGMSLDAFVKRWRSEYAVVQFKRTTLAYYDDILKRILPALGHLKLSEITPAHISKFYANLREQGIRVDVRGTAPLTLTDRIVKLYAKIVFSTKQILLRRKHDRFPRKDFFGLFLTVCR